MRVMRVLITGAAGFTGYYLSKYIKKGSLADEIFGIDLLKPVDESNCTWIQGDVRNTVEIANVLRQVKPTHIFHLAGLNFAEDPRQLFDINVLGTLSLFEAVSAVKDDTDPQILLVGSCAEYGLVNDDELPISEQNPLRPISPYGVSKAAQDLMGYQYYKSRGLKVIRTRAFNIVGPRQSDRFVCGALVKQISEIKQGSRDSVLEIGNLEVKRDFVDVHDVVRAYWRVMHSGRLGEVYNIGSGRSYSVEDILKILLREASVEATIHQSPQRIRQVDIPKQVSDISKIRRETGWVPRISLEESLREMLDHAYG